MKHGGDIHEIENLYGIKKEHIIDFSSNINPLGVSNLIYNAITDNISDICKYPDKNYCELKKSIAKYCSCDTNHIIVGNGATEIIHLFINTVSPKSAFIVSPTYSEYERELLQNNALLSFFPLDKDDDFLLDIDKLIIASKNSDIIVLCNPNNPTGTHVSNEDIERLLFTGKTVMIDETYAEFLGSNKDFSCVSLTKKYKNLLVIRGTSKFFALCGVRLGYGICSDEILLKKLEEKKELWSVNCFANVCGIAMFNDKNYIDNTINFITLEKKRIMDELSTLKNLKIYKSYANFFLCEILNNKITSRELFYYLLTKNILIRDSKNIKMLGNNFFRFCVLNKSENTMLINHLKVILK